MSATAVVMLAWFGQKGWLRRLDTPPRVRHDEANPR
jgi:hypothetical protein